MARSRRKGQVSLPARANPSSHRVSIGLCALLTAAVGLLDYVMGWEISFSLFYLAPVAAAAWFAGRRTGVVFSACCALVATAVRLVWHRPYVAVACNGAIELGIFLTVSLLLA